jgi:coenzyme PQQ synthesis protein D (PqqD)
MSHDFCSRVTTAPNVMLRVIGDEAVILNLKSGLYLGLDPVGTRIWTVLNNAPSIQAAYESLLTEYDVEPERLRQDLDELLDKLLEQGLIETAPGEAVAGY